MTKLEEIALAIHRARYPDAAVMDGIAELDPTVAVRALVEACAAVQAMREPTDAELESGYSAGCHVADYEVGFDQVSLYSAWKAMIDAILNEKPGA